MKVIQLNKHKILKLATDKLRYDKKNEIMWYLDSETNICYRYRNINITTWNQIYSGDRDFLDVILMSMPYDIVSHIPSQGVVSYTLPDEDEVIMYKVNSSNVAYMGYDKVNRKLYVEFNTGWVYVYYNVEPEIWTAMTKADSKGSFLHWFIKINEYDYDRITSASLKYTDKPLSPNAGTEHPNGYMTGFKSESDVNEI